MQKISKIKIGKSITAVLLCVVLLVTSIPMVLAAGEGEYDPIPTFTESDKGKRLQHLMTTAELRSASPRLRLASAKPAQKQLTGIC